MLRTWLGDLRPWTVGLQIRRLECEEREGRRHCPPPEEEPKPKVIDPDDMRSPENPAYTVGAWRRIKAWEASPEGIKQAEYKAQKAREYQEWKAAKAAELECRARMAQEDAEAEAAEAARVAAAAADRLAKAAELARLSIGKPWSQWLLADTSEGRTIAPPRGHIPDIWINR